MKFLSKVWQFFTLAFSFLSSHFSDYVLPAINIVEAIKKIVENPALDLITQATSNSWDNDFLNKVRELLSKVIADLKLLPVHLDNDTPDELINHLIEFLRTLEPEQRNAFYHKIASLLTQSLSPEEIKEFEADTLVQLAYAREKANVQ